VTAELGAGPIAVMAEVTVPTCPPAETLMPNLTETVIVDLHRSELSDDHSDTIATLPPTRPAPLYAQWPAPPAPTTVTLCAPVAPTLVAETLLTTVPSDVMADASVPTCNAEVVTNRRVIQSNDAALSVTSLEDTQRVVSVAVLPKRDSIDIRQAP
jgi:hypothetical protein